MHTIYNRKINPSKSSVMEDNTSKTPKSWAEIVQNAENTQQDKNNISSGSSLTSSSNTSVNNSAFPIVEILNLLSKPEFLLLFSKINDILNIFNLNLPRSDKIFKIASLFQPQT